MPTAWPLRVDPTDQAHDREERHETPCVCLGPFHPVEMFRQFLVAHCVTPLQLYRNDVLLAVHFYCGLDAPTTLP